MDKTNVTLMLDNKELRKTYERIDGKIEITSFSSSREVIYLLQAVEDLDGLYDIIEFTQSEPRVALIRGMAHSYEPVPQRRLKYKRDNDKPTLYEAALDWLHFDVDGYEGDFDIESIIKDLLPPEFHSVDYIYQVSNSCFLKDDKVSIHLFFMLSQKLTNEEVKNYLLHQECFQLDTGIYHCCQPIYTAPPKLINVPDPFNERIGIVKKGTPRVPTLDIPQELPQTASESGFRAIGGVGYMHYLNAISRTNSAHPNIYRAMCSYHSVYGVNADWTYFYEQVKIAVSSHKEAVARSNVVYLNQLRRDATRLPSLNIDKQKDTNWCRYYLRRKLR